MGIIYILFKIKFYLLKNILFSKLFFIPRKSDNDYANKFANRMAKAKLRGTETTVLEKIHTNDPKKSLIYQAVHANIASLSNKRSVKHDEALMRHIYGKHIIVDYNPNDTMDFNLIEPELEHLISLALGVLRTENLALKELFENFLLEFIENDYCLSANDENNLSKTAFCLKPSLSMSSDEALTLYVLLELGMKFKIRWLIPYYEQFKKKKLHYLALTPSIKKHRLGLHGLYILNVLNPTFLTKLAIRVHYEYIQSKYLAYPALLTLSVNPKAVSEKHIQKCLSKIGDRELSSSKRNFEILMVGNLLNNIIK